MCFPSFCCCAAEPDIPNRLPIHVREQGQVSLSESIEENHTGLSIQRRVSSSAVRCFQEGDFGVIPKAEETKQLNQSPLAAARVGRLQGLRGNSLSVILENPIEEEASFSRCSTATWMEMGALPRNGAESPTHLKPQIFVAESNLLNQKSNEPAMNASI